jgi:cytidyltransferase-like protein
VKCVYAIGTFDDLRRRHVRFLQEAARLGPLHVLLRSDEAAASREGRRPKFPEAERRYLLESIRYVGGVTLCSWPMGDVPAPEGPWPMMLAVDEASPCPEHETFCRAWGAERRVIRAEQLEGIPEEPAGPPAAGDRRRVMVTGCFDWFHSGHVRFFEEVAALGDLYVVVGRDANLRLLKGEGHPMFPEAERKYLVQSIRFVRRALVASGMGWLDAEAEIEQVRPHVYAVNEDGDRPEKRAYCEARGIEYRVLRRVPKEGLPRRQSTALRGF